MLYLSTYAFLAASLRDELRHYEMKNPRNCVDFIEFINLNEIQRNLIRQQILLRR